MATTSKSEFFVNAAVSDWVEFLSANEQVRSQHCPAPANNYTAISPRVLPDSFHLTDDWYLRLLTIAASPTQGVHIGLGVCGACYLETLEILREFYESLNGSVPNSHYFDPTEQITAVDQLSYSYPALYASLETIWQEALSDSIALTDQHRAGQITEEQYLTSFHTRFEQLHVSTQNNFLPDFYQVSPSTFRFTGYTDDMTQQINSILPNDTASVGTTAIVVTQFYLSNNQPDSHSVPLVRFSDGWSVLEVAVPNATLSRVDRYNRARFPTASEAIFNYFQTRSPYFINGHNNVNFGNISNIMLINQVNIRPITIVSNPLVSFGNCTGEGEDGRRGTGKLTPETQEKNSIQNLCVTESGEISRCYGARNLNETNSPSVVSECQHLYNSNGKEWLWNGSFGHYYSSKNTCENANMCNDNGGLCFQWKKREKGRCEHLNYYNNKWEWVIFPRYSTSSSCKAENKCSEGGACYQWVEN
nr:DUF1561 family protein [Enterovibrio nigricans]